jgi:hypothetical protein
MTAVVAGLLVYGFKSHLEYRHVTGTLNKKMINAINFIHLKGE